MRNPIPYILAAMFSIVVGVHIPASAEDSLEEQHVSGTEQPQPKVTRTHISGFASGNVPLSTIAHISGVSRPPPTTEPQSRLLSPEKVTVPVEKSASEKPSQKISRKKVLEMVNVEDRAARKKNCWSKCERTWKNSLKTKCLGDIESESKSCRRKLFQDRLTCVRQLCSKIE